MTKHEAIDIIDEIGFVEHSSAMNYDQSLFSESGWYTIEGMGNYALRISAEHISIWSRPVVRVYADDEVCALYTTDTRYSLKCIESDMLKNSLIKLKEDSYRAICELKELRKQQRIKAIREL